MFLQSAIRSLYPPRCLACGAEIMGEHALCGGCWRELPFISGMVCDCCGIPLPGFNTGQAELCDTCLAHPFPWVRARAPLLYDGTARKLVLALKHGDRLDLVAPMARWMARALGEVAPRESVILPVPLHRLRLFRRRYNQAALLGRAMSRMRMMPFWPDALIRHRHTRQQDDMGHDDRFANQAGAFSVHPWHRQAIGGRSVLLVDDVMTSGATLSACADACIRAGAAQVNCVVLARVARST